MSQLMGSLTGGECRSLSADGERPLVFQIVAIYYDALSNFSTLYLVPPEYLLSWHCSNALHDR